MNSITIQSIIHSIPFTKALFKFDLAHNPPSLLNEPDSMPDVGPSSLPQFIVTDRLTSEQTTFIHSFIHFRIDILLSPPLDMKRRPAPATLPHSFISIKLSFSSKQQHPSLLFPSLSPPIQLKCTFNPQRSSHQIKMKPTQKTSIFKKEAHS